MLYSSSSVTDRFPVVRPSSLGFSSPRFSSSSTTSSEYARTRALFSRFSTLLPRSTQPSLLLLPACLPAWLPRSPMSPFCYSFCPAQLRVFLARLLPLPDPFILLPGLSLSPSAFRHFSLFLYLFPSDPPPPTPPSHSFSLSRSPFHSCSLFFGRIGLFFPFPVTALPQFSSASLFYPLDVVFPVLLYSFLRLMITGIALLTAFPFRGIASLRSRFN